MKLSERLREPVFMVGPRENQRRIRDEAADLLDECERIIQAIAENDLDDQIADGGITVFDGIKQLSISALAKLRAAQEKADE